MQTKISQIINDTNLKHIAIIMDGNRRWAKEKNLPTAMGHKKGVDALRNTLRACDELGIKYLTVYAFSTENWKRPKEEVDAIMRLFKQYLLEAKDDITAAENNRLRFIGVREGVSDELLALMDEAEEETKNNTGCEIILAVNYGGREEIVSAVNKLIADGKTKITEDDISNNVYTAPDCDLIIRPSGEQRLSNFLLWQAAYSEFWYSDVLWPDFTVNDLYKALTDFQNRNRRFGG